MIELFRWFDDNKQRLGCQILAILAMKDSYSSLLNVNLRISWMRVMSFLRRVLKKTLSFESSLSNAWSLDFSSSESKKVFNVCPARISALLCRGWSLSPAAFCPQGSSIAQ